MPGHRPTKNIYAAHRGHTYLIQLRGVLGPSDCAALGQVLQEAEASSARSILLDLERLDALDAAGLHEILRASRRSAAGGDRLRVTRGKGYVTDLFRITALDRTVPFADGAQSEDADSHAGVPGGAA